MAIMDGRDRAAQRRLEEGITEAWHVEAFAREKRLKPLGEYLKAIRGDQPQTPEQMLAALKEIAGDNMTIEEVAASER